jgi:hypothetical protein
VSAAHGSLTTVSRSDIRLKQHFDSSAQGLQQRLVRRWLSLTISSSTYYPNPECVAGEGEYGAFGNSNDLLKRQLSKSGAAPTSKTQRISASLMNQPRAETRAFDFDEVSTISRPKSLPLRFAFSSSLYPAGSAGVRLAEHPGGRVRRGGAAGQGGTRRIQRVYFCLRAGTTQRAAHETGFLGRSHVVRWMIISAVGPSPRLVQVNSRTHVPIK